MTRTAFRVKLNAVCSGAGVVLVNICNDNEFECFLINKTSKYVKHLNLINQIPRNKYSFMKWNSYSNWLVNN